jgi:hypothetical protein
VNRILFLVAACCAAFAAPPSAADLARSLRQAGLDPDECDRGRDLSFQKEDIRIYLTDVYLIFSKPVAGEPRSALFTDEVEGGDAEVILLPPFRGERQSLASFTQSANLDEHFRSAVMIFSDATARTLLDRITQEGAGVKAKEMGALLADKWASVLANVQAGFEMRLVADLLGPAQPSGMLFVTLSGRRLGNFDLLYDPYSSEQIMAGRLAERGGKLGYNIWTNFAARSSRTGAFKPPDPGFAESNYRIEAALDADLRMKATTRVTVRVGPNPLGVMPFSISRAMHVAAARIDGAPAELFFQDSVRGQALNGNDNDAFLVIPPETLAARSEHQFEFEHDGTVVTQAGNGVYYVGARATWYPRGDRAFANYDLTFRYPKRLTLVTAGDLVEDRTDGDWRVTRRRTPSPIRLAGFNLGDYEKVSGAVPGYSIEIYANRHLEAALQPPLRETLPVPPEPPRPRGRGSLPEKPEPPRIPNSLARLRAVAGDVSSALEFFSAKFGPPALKTLTVAPIPGFSGQGFPGLVYLPTLSYLDPTELPQPLRSSQQQLSTTGLIEAHEVAHQWWGNVVTSGDNQDDWMIEALSSYSALLWAEKKKGPKALESVLDTYRDHLLAKDEEGHTIESAGPITWGARLDATGVPNAWNVITYEKGAWILHMLRRRMGDERFLKMLAELRRRYEFRAVTTENLRALAKEFRPPNTNPAAMDEFFDNWVYSTGIPSVKVTYSLKGEAPAVKLSGTLAQTGVDDDFSFQVPVEVQFAKGASQTIWVGTASDAVPFAATLRQKPLRVTVPAASVIVTKK